MNFEGGFYELVSEGMWCNKVFDGTLYKHGHRHGHKLFVFTFLGTL